MAADPAASPPATTLGYSYELTAAADANDARWESGVKRKAASYNFRQKTNKNHVGFESLEELTVYLETSGCLLSAS